MENRTYLEPPEHEPWDLLPAMMAGEWYVPKAGFQWRSDIRLSRLPTPEPRPLTYTRRYVWNERDGGPWLYHLRGETEPYSFLRRRGLLSAFEKLTESPTPERILEFAGRYGALGRHAIVQVRTGVDMDASGAEPLSLWLWELSNFKDILELRRAVRVLQSPKSYDGPIVQGARQTLSGRILWTPDRRQVFYKTRWLSETDKGLQRTDDLAEALRRKEEASKTPGVVIASADGSDRERLAFSQLKEGDNLSAAQVALREAINERLRGNIGVAVTVDDEVQFWPRNLLTAVYLLQGLELRRAQPVKRICANPRCSRGWFFLKRRNQRFCDKNCQEQAGYHRRKGQ